MRYPLAPGLMVLLAGTAHAQETDEAPAEDIGSETPDEPVGEAPTGDDGAEVTDENIGEARQPVCIAPNTMLEAACGGAPLACRGIPDARQQVACAISVCTAVAAYVDLGCPPLRPPWPQWPYHR